MPNLCLACKGLPTAARPQKSPRAMAPSVHGMMVPHVHSLWELQRHRRAPERSCVSAILPPNFFLAELTALLGSMPLGFYLFPPTRGLRSDRTKTPARGRTRSSRPHAQVVSRLQLRRLLKRDVRALRRSAGLASWAFPQIAESYGGSNLSSGVCAVLVFFPVSQAAPQFVRIKRSPAKTKTGTDCK